MHQSCMKRNVVYETWCADCLKRGIETEGQEGGSYKYIGESARSAYERGANHLNDRRTLDLGSHMLKHARQCHEKEDPHGVRFHMKVLEFHKSSLERQISEAVLIQKHRRSGNILNSKSEYNHPPVARIVIEKRKFDAPKISKIGCHLTAN